MNATTSSSEFLDACRKGDCKLAGELFDTASRDALLEMTDPRANALVVPSPEFSRTPLLHLLYQVPKENPELLPPLVQRFIDAKVDINATDASGKTALHYSAGQLKTGDYSRRNPSIVRLLVQAGADVNIVENQHGWTPLHEACSNQNDTEDTCIDIATHLLAANADLQAVDRNGDTPLHLCLAQRDEVNEWYWSFQWPQLAAFLMDKGADITKPSKDGMCAVGCVEAALIHELDDDGVGAVSGGLEEIITFLCKVVPALIRSGVSDLDKGVIGGRMLVRVMQEFNGDNDEDILEMHINPLLEFGADVNFADENGLTALHQLLLNRDLDEELWVDDGGLDGFVLNVIESVAAKSPNLNLQAVTNDGKSLADCAEEAEYSSVCAFLKAKRPRLDGNGN